MEIHDRKARSRGSARAKVAPFKTARDPAPGSEITTVSARTGRPRSRSTHKAIIAAVLSMLKREDYGDISIERIAAKARVSKHSIYRRWNTKGEVVLDAFNDYALQKAAQVDPTDDAFADLEKLVVRAFQAWQDPLYAKGLRGLIIEMSFDPGLRQKFTEVYLTPRKRHLGSILKHGVDLGQLRANLDIEAAVDVIFGFIWFHLSYDALALDERRAAQGLITLLRPSLQVQL